MKSTITNHKPKTRTSISNQLKIVTSLTIHSNTGKILSAVICGTILVGIILLKPAPTSLLNIYSQAVILLIACATLQLLRIYYTLKMSILLTLALSSLLLTKQSLIVTLMILSICIPLAIYEYNKNQGKISIRSDE